MFERWEQAGVFSPEPEGEAAENFSIAVPPPNVTGALHMGHALNGTYQDLFIRRARMQGRRAKWIFGTDHAGIATQVKVEQALEAEGTSKEELGRDAFVDRVWEWRREYGGQINQQFRSLGASLDYADERFTMDEAYARAVQEVFVRLYEKGLIYRDNYMVNWDPGTRSAISDLEVEQRSVDDTLYEIDYPLESGSGSVTVATVRPETMLADTAIAVNPADERYTRLIGERATLPLVGRSLPIIADEYVKTDFGTGALKITPGHDPNDFEIGRRHGLQEISVIGEDGLMTEEAGERFAGMEPEEARKAIVEALRNEGCLSGSEPYTHDVPYSHRSGQRIEPLISLQWFCDMEQLAGPAIECVKDGRVRFHPERPHTQVYLDWLENIRPWCVSRQLWWGHRIPAWYRGDEVHVGSRGARGRRLGARPRRAGHLVLLRPVAVRHAGLARADRPAARVLPHRRAHHGPGHHLPVGGPHGHAGHRVHGRGAVRPRVDQLHDHGPRRAPHVQVAGHRDRPAGRDRRARRRRRPLRPRGHGLDPGRALLGRPRAPGPGPGQQALERLAADPAGRGRGRRALAPTWPSCPRTAGSCRGWSG